MEKEKHAQQLQQQNCSRIKCVNRLFERILPESAAVVAVVNSLLYLCRRAVLTAREN